MILLNSSHEVYMSYNDTIILHMSLYRNNEVYIPQEEEELWFFLSQNGRLLAKEQLVYDDNLGLWVISLPSLGHLLPIGTYYYDIKIINNSSVPPQQYALISPTLWSVMEVVPNE